MPELCFAKRTQAKLYHIIDNPPRVAQEESSTSILICFSFELVQSKGLEFIFRYFANLQIGVKLQNEKSQHNFCGMKMGIAKQAGQREIFANRLNRADIFG